MENQTQKIIDLLTRTNEALSKLGGDTDLLFANIPGEIEDIIIELEESVSK